jgi:hypothetical protein
MPVAAGSATICNQYKLYIQFEFFPILKSVTFLLSKFAPHLRILPQIFYKQLKQIDFPELACVPSGKDLKTIHRFSRVIRTVICP